MNHNIVGLFAAIALTGVSAAPALARNIPAYVTAAVNDSNRPDSERQADSYRLPAASVAFAGVKRGDTVLELLGLGGYYTHILSKVVGPKGHVYTTIPTALANNEKFAGPVRAIAADPQYSNVTALVQSPGAPTAPTAVDVVWTSDDYHDLHNPGPFSAGDMDAFNKAVFAALKPGGLYIVIDHSGAPGTGATQTSTLHRIEPATAKAEILKAGFIFDGQSNALHRASEDYTAHSTFRDEQFIFRFRKPR
jgi:predicted methyltransferase